MTYDEFINSASAGATITYHTGVSLGSADQNEIWPLRKAYNDGVITFKQRIVDRDAKPRMFEYIAEKLYRKRPPAPAYGKDRPNVAVHLFNKVG